MMRRIARAATFPRCVGVIGCFTAFIRLMHLLERAQTPPERAQIVDAFVRRIIRLSGPIVEAEPLVPLPRLIRNLNTYYSLWALTLLIIPALFIVYKNKGQLTQEQLPQLLQIAIRMQERSDSIQLADGRRFRRLNRWRLIRRYRRLQRAQVLGLQAIPRVVLGVAYIQIGTGDMDQNLQSAFAHFERAALLLRQVTLPSMDIAYAGVYATLATYYLNYPTEHRAEFVKKAVAALDEAYDAFGTDYAAAATNAPDYADWQRVFSDDATRRDLMRYMLQRARSRRQSRRGKRPIAAMLGPMVPLFAAWVKWKLSVALLEEGDYTTAIVHADVALRILDNVGKTFRSKEDRSQLERMYVAVSLNKGSAFLRLRSENRRADIHAGIAAISAAIKRVKALPAESEALRLYAMCLLKDAEGYFAHENLGTVTEEAKKTSRPKVINQLRAAARLARRSGAFQVMLDCLLLLGKTYLAEGDKVNAWRTFAVSARIIDRMQRQARSYRLARYWVEKAAEVYELLVRTSFEGAPVDKGGETDSSRANMMLDVGMSCMELGRSLLLVRELGRHGPIPRGAKQEDLAVAKFLSARKGWLDAELRLREQELVAGAEGNGQRARLTTMEARYLRELEAVRQQYGDPDYSPDRPGAFATAKDLNSMVMRLSKASETAIVEYFLTDRYLVATVVSREGAWLLRSSLSRADIGEIGTRWHEGLERLRSGGMSWLQWERGVLKQVLERLRPAIERPLKLLPGAKRIVVIPHRILHLIPMHAIELEDGRTLGEAVSIQYAPSASVLLQLMDLRRVRRAARAGGASSSSEGSRLVAIGYAPKSRPLIFHDDEVRFVSALEPHGKAILGNEATSSTVKSAIQDAEYIHFACHGRHNEAAPLGGGLLLASGKVEPQPAREQEWGTDRAAQPEKDSDDGCLTLGEVFQDLQLQRARLVVLSACESGQSKVERRHDEYIGLPAGFLMAGATTVVGSLWPVADVATWLLMRSFSRGIVSGQSSATALRNAQVELRTMGREQAWQELAALGSRETDPDRRRLILDQGLQLQGDHPFSSRYWWAGFTVNGLGDVAISRTP